VKKLVLLLLMLLIASSALAAKKPCPCAKPHRKAAQPCTTVVVPPAPAKASESSSAYAGGLYDALVDGFSVTGGFRWDEACPTAHCSAPRLGQTGHSDPFFVGLEERLPINSSLELGGNFDRDFTDSPNWSARVYLAAHPWRK